MSTDIKRIQSAMNISTWVMVILNVLSLGAYQLMWNYRLQEQINSTTEHRAFERSYIWMLAVLFGLSTLFSGGDPADDVDLVLYMFSAILSIAYIVANLVLAFKFRKVLTDVAYEDNNTHIVSSSILLFFFGQFYVNYKLNQAAKE